MSRDCEGSGVTTQPLEEVFGELGISHYLAAFIDQGFDSWETILDITESDLDALGVKLGHRRKLQRRIANSRGIAPQASLISPSQPHGDDGKLDSTAFEIQVQANSNVKFDAPRETSSAVMTKRKYRRHPKPDENAPDRPPSAYVLFSNRMREELKGRNLTFTEIAKLVGENWQNLSPAEKDPYESQAQKAKDRYNSDLGEYKKTQEYKTYTLYLQEFREKHAHLSQDGSKRVKLSDNGAFNGHSGFSADAPPSRTSRSGSGSDSQLGSEPPGRLNRLDSVVSTADSCASATATPASNQASTDCSATSPTAQQSDRQSTERSPMFDPNLVDPSLPGRRRRRWPEDARIDSPAPQQQLPPLTEFFDRSGSPSHNKSTAGGPQGTKMDGHPSGRNSRISDSPGPPPGLIGGKPKPPFLRHEPCSAASSSSGGASSISSVSSIYPRTPLESSSLPIHALLSSKQYDAGGQPGPFPTYLAAPPFPPAQHMELPYDGTAPYFALQYSSGPLSSSPAPVLNRNYSQRTAPALTHHHHHRRPHHHNHQQQLFSLPPNLQGAPGGGYRNNYVPQRNPPPSQSTTTSSWTPAKQQDCLAAATGGLDGMSALLKAGEMVDRRR